MYLIAVIVGLFIALIAWATLGAIFSDERAVAKRLNGLTAYEASEAASANPVLTPFSKRVVRPSGERFTAFLRRLAPSDYTARLRTKLAAAGNPRGMDVGRFLVIKFLTTLGAICLFVGVAVLAGASPLVWLVVIGACVLSFWLADLWLSSRIDARKTAIRRALPDMLDMLTISVEAGLGFDQAVAKLVKTSHGPLAEELGRMLQQVQAGVDRSDALRQLAARCDVPELTTFTTAIVQADILGISISQVLRTQAREMRLLRRQRAEERAQKAPVKIVFPLVLCILPATLIVILGPAIVRISVMLEAF